MKMENVEETRVRHVRYSECRRMIECHMEAEAKFGRDARPARPWSCGTHGLAVVLVVSVLCICTVWASAADGARMSAIDVQSVKVLAEKGDAAVQFRYAEMLRDGCSVKGKG